MTHSTSSHLHFT